MNIPSSVNYDFPRLIQVAQISNVSTGILSPWKVHKIKYSVSKQHHQNAKIISAKNDDNSRKTRLSQFYLHKLAQQITLS